MGAQFTQARPRAQTTFIPALVALGLLLVTVLSALYVTVSASNYRWRDDQLVAVDKEWHAVPAGRDLLIWTHDSEKTPTCAVRNSQGTPLLLEDPHTKFWRRDQRGGMVGTWKVKNSPSAAEVRCTGKGASQVAVTAYPLLPPFLTKYGDLIWLPVGLAGFSMISLAWLSSRVRASR